MKLKNNLHLEDVALAFPSDILFKRLHFLHDVLLCMTNIWANVKYVSSFAEGAANNEKCAHTKRGHVYAEIV